MARIRTIKPEFFRHEELFEAEQQSGLPLRLSFISLWTIADREGRFRWKPRALKLDCLPYDDLDFEKVLDELSARGFIVKYEVGGEMYGVIPSFTKHQIVNQREAKSTLPDASGENVLHMHARASTGGGEHIPNGVNIPGPLRQTVFDRDGRKCLRCDATEDLTVDHIFPQSIGGTHAITNLRCLCRKCNSARPVQGQALLDDLARDGFTLDDMQRICMHVQARGEGKGREQEGEREEEQEQERKLSASRSCRKPVSAGSISDAREFYDTYPKHVDPRAAEKKFLSLVKSGVDPQRIIAAAGRFAEAHRKAGTDKQMIPAPAVWLNRGGYDSEDLPAPIRAGPAQQPPKVTYASMLAKLRGYGQNDETSFDFNSKTIDADPVGAEADPRFSKTSIGN